MGGFILEVLAGRSWTRQGQTYWTRIDAVREAERLLRRGKAVEVRVLAVEVGAEAVESLSADDCSPDADREAPQ